MSVASLAKRRLEMVILSAPRALDSVREVAIIAAVDNTKLHNLTRQFIPQMKLHNPQVNWTWNSPIESQNECVTVKFSDDSVETIDPINFPSYHYIAQQILDIDRRKSLELVAAR